MIVNGHKMSSGESIIYNYLTSHGYYFKYGATPKWLKGQHLDFLVHVKDKRFPKSKFWSSIEYDGSQHHLPTDFSKHGHHESLKKQLHDLRHYKDMDNIKDIRCMKHHLPLIRVEDMNDLSSKNYHQAIQCVDASLDKILPNLRYGIHKSYISIKNIPEMKQQRINQKKYKKYHHKNRYKFRYKAKHKARIFYHHKHRFRDAKYSHKRWNSIHKVSNHYKHTFSHHKKFKGKVNSHRPKFKFKKHDYKHENKSYGYHKKYSYKPKHYHKFNVYKSGLFKKPTKKQKLRRLRRSRGVSI